MSFRWRMIRGSTVPQYVLYCLHVQKLQGLEVLYVDNPNPTWDQTGIKTNTLSTAHRYYGMVLCDHNLVVSSSL